MGINFLTQVFQPGFGPSGIICRNHLATRSSPCYPEPVVVFATQPASVQGKARGLSSLNDKSCSML